MSSSLIEVGVSEANIRGKEVQAEEQPRTRTARCQGAIEVKFGL